MRILYGVVGEGMGHAMRSRVVVDHLLSAGHEVEIVASGRGFDYLRARTLEPLERGRLGVARIWGYSLVYQDNQVRNWKSLVRNVRGAVKGWPANVRAYLEMTRRFEPEVVISDFESWSTLYAKNWRLPLVSLDNIQIVDRCRHADAVVEGHRRDFRLASAVVKAKVPGAFHYLLTTFFYPPVRKARTTLHPPVLRPEILAAKTEEDDHLLVYQTSTSNRALPETLRRCGLECRIYGLRRDLAVDAREGNLIFRPFSEKAFVDDLRTARGVVASGGFTLLGEAVYLHRPVLCAPVGQQFEQLMNARYLDEAGFGRYAPAITPAALGAFIERLPDFRTRLATYRQDGNRDLFAKLDEILTRAVAAG